VKGPDAFRTISEAADQVGVAQHVLRFWETKFSFIRPMKRAGGRRFYRPGDIQVLSHVRRLLHAEGYTIRRVQSLHRQGGFKALCDASDTGDVGRPTGNPGPGRARPNPRPEHLRITLDRLQAAKARLDELVAASCPEL
jgi:DNA-binding transcriptional MerR regulator